MYFALKLFWRLSLAAALCLVAAMAWITWSTNRFLQDDIAASADRVAGVILDRERFGAGDPHAMVITTALKSMAPGVCVDIVGPSFPEQTRLCSGWGDTGAAEPAWFTRLLSPSFDKESSVSRVLMFGSRQEGMVVATAEPVIVVRRAWARFQTIAYAAVIMTLVTTTVAALVVGHALLPAKALVLAMQKLGREDYAARVPRLGEPEFQRFADAFNTLADRLEAAQAARVALTRRLFRVQEEERLALARELHDEFGQCLTSAGALAASIESGAPEAHKDLALEARLIGDVVVRMKTTLRSALRKLRPPELEEVGLVESLRTLVASWNQNAPPTTFTLDAAEPFSSLEREKALAVYRTVQEGLTNAVRHGSARNVRVRLSVGAGDPPRVVVSIEDDGALDPRPAPSKEGLGIVGMRERISAFGGDLLAARRDGGFLVEATLPLDATGGAA